MSIESLREILPPEQAEGVLRFWSTLIASEKIKLAEQIKKIDFKRLKEQVKLINHSESLNHFEPYTDYALSGNESDFLQGQKLLKEGKMGCIVMAGGQGTRLGFEGPKGLYPTSVIKHKSLFQLFCEKAAAASQQAGCELQIAIMTSPDNDVITKQFLSEQNYFGLNPDQIGFYSQGMVPFLDAGGHLFLETPYKISEGPDGNGQCLHNFCKAGLWEEWHKKGIEYVNLILIDNPLADPFDAELLGFHAKRKVDVTIKCTEKLDPEEKMGVLVKEGSHCRVIEYSELPEPEKQAAGINGHLKHCCANLSLFCFSMDFIKHAVAKHPLLPLHKAWKAAKYVTPAGITKTSPTPIAWKFENFIFDILPYTTRTAALLYPRSLCYAPLKNYMGENSITSVQEALLKLDREVLQSITGLEAPSTPFELSADFHYPTPELLSAWVNREPETTYVEP